MFKEKMDEHPEKLRGKYAKLNENEFEELKVDSVGGMKMYLG